MSQILIETKGSISYINAPVVSSSQVLEVVSVSVLQN